MSRSDADVATEMKTMGAIQRMVTEEKGEALKVPNDNFAHFEMDGSYAQKSLLVNQALHDIGMNAWQYKMWVLCGLGWVVDNVRILVETEIDIKWLIYRLCRLPVTE